MCLSHLWRKSPKIQSEESRIEEQSNVLPLHQPQQSYAPPPLANAEARPSQGPSEQSPAQTIFAQASNFHLEHFHYNQYDGQQRQGNSGWEQLLKATSTNALHNSIARFDPPKCDENTRVELIREIGTWIEDRHLSTQLLCMTGAAGSGKSALQQTLAEACVAKGILAASFFFNTGDNTRNNVSRIIPTLAYQLGQKNNALRRMIGIAVEDDALIFNQTLRTQIEKLILNPVTHLPPSELASLPYAIIIDGLDECKEERDQRTLLRAIHECFIGRRSPFRIFLASRPELAIFEALEPGGHLHGIIYPIRLSDDYDATSDIRLTLRRNFTEIGLRRRWEHAWFTEADIEAIVTAASGQYIYAATVIRYVSEPRRSPVERLRTILSSQSGTGSGTKPFALLDLLYTLVLNNAREGYEAIDNRHDFLLVLRVYLALNDLNLGLGISRQDQLLGLEEGTYESILCDLRSLLIAQPTLRRGHQIRVYHKSFLDYLNTPERAGPLYTPFSRYVECITRCCLRRIDSYSLKQISGGVGFSDEDFKLRYKELDLDLLDCAALLCPTFWREASFSFTSGDVEGIVTILLQFGSSGFKKIHTWVVHPVVHYHSSPEFIRNTNPRYEFVERWKADLEPALFKEIKNRSPELAKDLKQYSDEWAAWKATLIAEGPCKFRKLKLN